MTLTQINRAGLDEIALDHVFTIGASGNSAYTFQGEGLNGTVNNPTLYLTRGKTYRFENGSGGHPIRIQSTFGSSGTAYNTGVTNNAGSGTVIVEVQHDAPDVLYYQCTSHSAMNGLLYITGALADGGVTTAKLANDAVTTAKIADDAVTGAKIADATIAPANLVDGCATTIKINDGAITNAKVNASAAIAGTKISPDFGSQTISTTGTTNLGNTFLSGGADGTLGKLTLALGNGSNKEATIQGTSTSTNEKGINLKTYHFARIDALTITPAGLVGIGTASPDSKINIVGTGNDGNTRLSIKDGSGIANVLGRYGNLSLQADKADAVAGSLINFTVDDSEKMRIDANGKVGIGKINPTFKLDVEHSNETTVRLGNSSETGHGSHEVKLVAGRNYYHSFRFEGSSYRFFGWNGSNIPEHFRIRSTGGVTFNGDTADANALDDYEEGTFSPYIRGHQTAGSWSASSGNGGFYVKVGKQVTCWINCSGTLSNASGNMNVYGLPFTSAGTNQPSGAGNSNYSSGTVQYWAGAGQDIIGALVPSGNAYIYFHTDNGSSTGSQPTVGNGSHNLHCIVSYFVP